MEKTLLEELHTLTDAKQLRKCREILETLNEVDVAEFLEELSKEQSVMVFRVLSKELAANVFTYLESDIQEAIVDTLTDIKLIELTSGMFLDDTVDFLEEMPSSVVKRVLKNVTKEKRDLINQFLKYPENSAGSIMTAEYVELREDMTVREAFNTLRKTAFNKESVYTCYITNKKRELLGEVTVKTLLMSNDDDIIKEMMDDVISVNTLTDKEEAAQIFQRYDLFSAPVVDNENRLVGFITVDDALDVLEQEATEDIEKMSALHPSVKPYLKTSVLTMTKNRILWLMVLMISGMITGTILGKFEHAFSTVPILVTFIPMLTDTGGNAGSQASTLIIRGMAIGELSSSDFLRILFKEIRVSLLAGLILGSVTFLRIFVFSSDPTQPMLPLVVALSTFITVVIAKTMGAILPLFARAIKADPALMASPLITTIVDALALMIYFSIAKVLLNF